MTEKPAQNPMPQSKWINLCGSGGARCCGARTRSAGECRQPAMANGRCRLHGGKSTGPRTADGLRRLSEARTKHGAFGKTSRQVRAIVRSLKASSKQLIEVT